MRTVCLPEGCNMNETRKPDDVDVKPIEELLAQGGKFYSIADQAWCDLPESSWKLVPERGGYVRQD